MLVRVGQVRHGGERYSIAHGAGGARLPSMAWHNGIVKAVHSGDCLTIMSKVANGPPPEKVVTLSSLLAPRVALNKPDSRDEPHAWARCAPHLLSLPSPPK
jgi:hypothetical protein